MKATALLVGGLWVAVACGQDDVRRPASRPTQRAAEGRVFLAGVRAAERKAFGSEPLKLVNVSHNFGSLKRAGTREYDKEYAKFVTEIEGTGLLEKRYSLVVNIGKVSPGKDEGGVFTVEGTWTPLKRRWKYYMTENEKRDYGKVTGEKRYGRMPIVRTFRSESDERRDALIESKCNKRKQTIEQISVRMVLSAEKATDIRLIETAQIVGTVSDFSITYHEGHGHAVTRIEMDVSDVKVKKRHK
jgi:hypothetical protein